MANIAITAVFLVSNINKLVTFTNKFFLTKGILDLKLEYDNTIESKFNLGVISVHRICCNSTLSVISISLFQDDCLFLSKYLEGEGCENEKTFRNAVRLDLLSDIPYDSFFNFNIIFFFLSVIIGLNIDIIPGFNNALYNVFIQE